MKCMTNVLGVINGLFTTAIRGLYPGHTHLMKGVVQSSGPGGRFGDYKCIAAMSISQVCQLNHKIFSIQVKLEGEKTLDCVYFCVRC